jgi:hypothetical protein
MAYTTIDKPSDYFNTVLWTGNDGTNAIATGHATSMVWLKWRGGSNNHQLQDIIRGVTKPIFPNTTGAESTVSPSITAFTSTGFTLGDDEGDYNTSGREYVGWSWKAGTAFSNDASATGIGTIDSTGSVNTDAGFSIISYTGTGSAGTVAHGLGVAPKFIIFKNRNGGFNWNTYHSAYSPAQSQEFNTTNAAESNGSAMWNSTATTSSVFSLGNANSVNQSSAPIVAYCFADVKGYSKFGSYVGNGSNDGTFCYLGFKPAFLLIKQTGASGKWLMIDNKRDPDNACNHRLNSDVNFAENTGSIFIDMLSNGWKFRTTDTDYNTSGVSGIYMAFAENPFVTSTGVPATAR